MKRPAAPAASPPRQSANELRSTKSYNSAALLTTASRQPFDLPKPSTKPTGLKYAAEDGTSHINIHSRGKTDLGRRLSHYWKTPFEHPFYGRFDSMEAFWYYIKAAQPDDQLRRMYGAEAKFYGSKLPQGPLYESFYDVIIEANFYKVVGNPDLALAMERSTLPFDMYYLHGPGPIFSRLPNFEWLVQGMEQIRSELKSAREANVAPAWPTPRYEAHLD